MKFLIGILVLSFCNSVLSLKCYKCRDDDEPVYIQNSKCANNSNSHVFDCDKQCIFEGLVFHYSVDANDELTYHRVYVHRGCGSFFTKDFCNFHKNKTKKKLYQKVFVQKYECDNDLCNGDKFVYNLDELKKSEVLCEKTAINDSGLNLKRNQLVSAIREKRNDRARRPTPKAWKQARQDDIMMPMMFQDMGGASSAPPDATMSSTTSSNAPGGGGGGSNAPGGGGPGGKPQDDPAATTPTTKGTSGGTTGTEIETVSIGVDNAPISIKIHPMVFIPLILAILLQFNIF